MLVRMDKRRVRVMNRESSVVVDPRSVPDKLNTQLCHIVVPRASSGGFQVIAQEENGGVWFAKSECAFGDGYLAFGRFGRVRGPGVGTGRCGRGRGH